jgi:hypothetical protein
MAALFVFDKLEFHRFYLPLAFIRRFASRFFPSGFV